MVSDPGGRSRVDPETDGWMDEVMLKCPSGP